MKPVDLLVVGAGASGLFCAREVARSGLDVLVLERSPAPGRKLAISGGGKANFTNRHISPQDYLCHHDAHFCIPALKAFSPDMMLRQVQQWHLPVEERSHGQMFLSVTARSMVQCLVSDYRRFGGRLFCNSPVECITPKGELIEVRSGRRLYLARRVLLAMGSPAWPQIGGSGSGYRLAQSLGHKVIPPRPALTPLLLGQNETDMAFRALSGISLPVRISVCIDSEIRSWEDDLLFTHDGLSGPAVLKASLFWQEGTILELDLLPDMELRAMLDANEAGRQTPRGLLARLLPQRLVDILLPQDLARRKLAELSRKQRDAIQQAVSCCQLVPIGRAGLKKAEVCAGGVCVSEVDPRTMESLLVPNIWLAGEMLDVTGLLGGYNLHWAWASGMAVARGVVDRYMTDQGH